MKRIALLMAVVVALLQGCGGQPSPPTASPTSPTGYDPQLEIRSPNGTWSVPLSRLQREVKVQRVTVGDTLFGKQKTYEGFYLQDLAAFSHNTGAETVIFHCRDGFSLRVPVVTARRAGLVLAFHDVDVPEGFGSSKDNPVLTARRDRAAAFVNEHQAEYEKVKDVPAKSLTPDQRKLIGEYETAVSERDRWGRRVDELSGLGTVGPFTPRLTNLSAEPQLKDWEAPDAVRAIEFEHVVAFAGRDFPTGAENNAEVMRGFRLFHAKCVNCHSMNLAGGKSAPELNVPVNVTEYFSEKHLVPFILNARSIRAGSMMPVQPEITRKDAESIVAYLKYMKGQKIEY